MGISVRGLRVGAVCGLLGLGLLLPLGGGVWSRRLALPASGRALRADTLVVTAVGDIMLGSDYPSRAGLPPADDAYALLEAAVPYLRRGHVVFGNLEGAFLDGGRPAKRCSDPSRCYVFRMPTRYAGALRRAGFNALSMANNHVGDFGAPAQRRTVQLLDSLGIAHAGLLALPVAVMEVQGFRVGLCAFAPNSGTNQLNSYTTLRQTVRDLKARCDVVIASCHMGGEGGKHRRITRSREIYLGENRGNPYEVARVLIDAGADLVLGHGPHVPRAVDLYRDRFIVYSMGNFCTYGGFNLRGQGGYAPLFEIRMSRTGVFVEARLHGFVQQGRGGVRPDTSGAVIGDVAGLTELDIPEAGLRVERASGLISRKP